MVKLICPDSVSQWEHEQISQYPEIKFFIEKLKNMILKNPDKGLTDSFLSVKGKSIPCYKRTVGLNLFNYQYAIGYNFLTAKYIFNVDTIFITNMFYS